MEWLGNLSLSPEQTGLATLIVIVAGAIFAAWSKVFGKNQGQPKPRVQEFYAAGALADMGPVRELVEQTGLLVQQQVRTNMALETCAAVITRVALAYESHLKEEATQEEIENRAQQLFERRLAKDRPQRRSVVRKEIP